MQNLFRRASFLFWQYPILWLPIVIVYPLVFGLNLLANKLTHAIILSVFTTHSVLGNAPEPIAPPTSLQTLKWLLLTKPIDWGTHLVAICLYACALVATGSMISAIRSAQKLLFGRIFSPLQRSLPSLVYFSLKLLIVIGILAVPFSLFTFVFFEKNGARYISIQNFSLVFGTLYSLAIGYFMAPAAVKFLRPHNSEAISSEKANIARISSVLAVIASGALSFITAQVRSSFLLKSANWSYLLYDALTSLISATPYIVLFIALSLLAENNGRDVELFGGELELT
jgi:hypothetical protein